MQKIAMYVFVAILVLSAVCGIGFGEELVKIETSQVADDVESYGTFQSHNQKIVCNDNGIFLTYQIFLVDTNDGKEIDTWRLARSSDGGKTFRTIYESVDEGTRAPVIETDKDNTLYLAHPSHKGLMQDFLFSRFYAADDYKKPAITRFEDVRCDAKYSMAFDSKRDVFYIVTQYAEMLTVDKKGSLVHRQRLIATAGPNAMHQYPSVFVTSEGIIHYSWTTLKEFPPGKSFVYWDIHYMSSDDGGKTWHKLDKTVLPETPVPDDTGPTDKISVDSGKAFHNWLSSFLPTGEKIHFIYQSYSSGMQNEDGTAATGLGVRYVSYNLSDGKKESDISPRFSGETISLVSSSALFASDANDPCSPLYCVTSCETVNEKGQYPIGCLVSYDDGKTWKDYAKSDSGFRGIYALGGNKRITTDGYIVGSFTEQKSKGHNVHFFKIKVPIKSSSAK